MNQSLTAQGPALIPFKPNTALVPLPDTLQAVADFMQGPRDEFIVVSPTMTEHAYNTITAAMNTLLVTEDDYKEAGERLNRLGKIEKALEKRYLSRGRFFTAVATAFRAEAMKVITPAAAARKHLSDEMGAFRRLQEEKRAEAIREQQRLQREEEARRQAAADAARKAADAAKAAAEAQQREQERLQWEAQDRERLAAEKLTEGSRTAATVDQGAQDLAVAAAADARAEQARLAAEDAQRQADALEQEAAAAALVAAAPVAAAPVFIPELTKAKGTKFKRVPTILTTDKAKLSLTYLEVDEALLKRHILDGALGAVTPGVIIEGPGVKYVSHEVATGTGR